MGDHDAQALELLVRFNNRMGVIIEHMKKEETFGPHMITFEELIQAREHLAIARYEDSLTEGTEVE